MPELPRRYRPQDHKMQNDWLINMYEPNDGAIYATVAKGNVDILLKHNNVEVEE
jgi:hypothetical protein